MQCNYCAHRSRLNFETTFCKRLNVDLAPEYAEAGAPKACPLNSIHVLVQEAKEIKAGYKKRAPSISLTELKEYMRE